ncbi:MAG: hypothetical protein AB7K63_08705 [Vicinamibacterales bacterium]
MTPRIRVFALTVLCALISTPLLAQGPPGGRGGPPPTGREGARADFTGNWVSVVSEDWRWRMITPPKGDYANIPVNVEGRKIADGWDPARDTAAGEQCRAYAAPAIMREPGRLRVSWQDDNTLKIETDAGEQTRLFHFNANPQAGAAAEPTWQGYSVARWEPAPRAVQGNGIGLGLGPRAGTRSRTLEVTTTRIRPGYLRKNGVPFSANVRMTEYFDLFKDQDGLDWFVVTTVVEDPQYLNGPWITTSHFKKEPDGSRWNPIACQAR